MKFLKKQKNNIISSSTTFFVKKSSAGFTLIETLVAITILLMSIVGPMTLAKQGVASFRLVKNQIVAFYLVQESIEYMRNVRDSNIISGSEDWLVGLRVCEDDGVGSNKCQIDVVENNVSSCNSQCDLLRISEEGFYGYNNSWTETDFRRDIHFVQNNEDEMFIEVTMYWDHDRKSYTVRELLFKYSRI